MAHILWKFITHSRVFQREGLQFTKPLGTNNVGDTPIYSFSLQWKNCLTTNSRLRGVTALLQETMMTKKTIDITKVGVLEELQSTNERIAKLESVIFPRQPIENTVMGVYTPDTA